MTLSPQTRRELANLDDAGIADLLGEILDPSIDTPFEASDELIDALIPISDAYSRAYPLVRPRD